MPDDFFRVRLVCVLLDTCGMCFDRGTQKKKLDNFLTFFQVLIMLLASLWTTFLIHSPNSQYYILCKEDLPMDVDFMLSDSLEVHFQICYSVKSYWRDSVWAGSQAKVCHGQDCGRSGHQCGRNVQFCFPECRAWVLLSKICLSLADVSLVAGGEDSGEESGDEEENGRREEEEDDDEDATIQDSPVSPYSQYEETWFTVFPV